MSKNQSNDKNHVLMAFLVPKPLPVILARVLGWKEPQCLAVFLNRETKAIDILEVPV